MYKWDKKYINSIAAWRKLYQVWYCEVRKHATSVLYDAISSYILLLSWCNIK